MLKRLLHSILCLHERQSWPRRQTQRCLDCGALRPYVIGKKPGKWGYDRPPAEQRVYQFQKEME